MPRRVTNDLLLATLLALVLSGLLGWALPQGSAVSLFQLHRALGLALLVLIGWKTGIVLPSLRRRLGRDSSTYWGCIAASALLATVVLGLAWTLNIISFDLFWGYSPMNVHVALGIGLLPFVGWHAWIRRRPNRASAPVVSRRTALRLGVVALAGAAGWTAVEPLAGLWNAMRLPSGSKPAASFSANDYPAEIWLFDSVPSIEAETWRLRVGERQLSLDDLLRHPRREVQAVLDCTSGWWTEQVWSGVSLVEILNTYARVGHAVTVTSVTGHRIEFPLADVRNALLATHVGDEVLSPGHGYPVRLVVPGRRGYQWVKWVAEISVS